MSSAWRIRCVWFCAVTAWHRRPIITFAGVPPFCYNKGMENRRDQGGSSPRDAHASRGLGSATLIATIADTTWRMFVPSVGFTLLGVWLDEQFQTKPWLMLTGIVLGCVLAVMLVRRQIMAIRRLDDV